MVVAGEFVASELSPSTGCRVIESVIGR